MLNKKSIVLFIITFLITFSFINEYTTFRFDLNKEINQSYNNIKKVYNSVIKLQNDHLKSLALLFANDNIVKQAYIDNDPQLLKNHLFNYWTVVKEDNLIYEIHFFKPPAESFVNFSNFASIGNDVSDARTDIAWVTSSFKESSHTMMCKTFAGIRGTFPIIKNGKILGGLSLGKKIDWLPQTIKELTQNDVFLIYTHDSTKTLTKKYYKEFMQDKIQIDDLLLADKTIEISPDTVKHIDFNKEIQNININGNKYSLNIYKIYDFNKNLLAYLCVLNDLENFYNTFYTKTFKNLFLLFIAGLFIYVLLIIKINTILAKIKTILNLTNDIKEGNFKKLPQKENGELKSFKTNDALKNLELNVIDMGKNIEANIQQYHSMEQQRRLATMGEMMGNIAHQWRQPLSTISTSASGAKLQHELGILNDKSFNDLINHIIESTKYLSSTIDTFRDFLKDDVQYSMISIKDTCEKTVQIINPSLKLNHIQLIQNINDDLKIMGSTHELEQAFMNLFNNSIHALIDNMPKEYDKVIFFTTKNIDNNSIEVVIKDNGGGIDPKIIDRIFEPYFTTKHQSQGTGLGLTMVDKIIKERHNGKIYVNNEEFEFNGNSYKGACFTITFFKN